MADIRVKVTPQSEIKSRVGQQNSLKVVSAVSGSAGGKAVVADNVIGGIASVSSLYVSGVSTFVGLGTFVGDLYIGNNLIVGGTIQSNYLYLNLQDLNTVNLNVTGISTFNSIYYNSYGENGVAYFNNTGLLTSTGSPTNNIDYTNYVLTTNNLGVPAWSSVIDGGEY